MLELTMTTKDHTWQAIEAHSDILLNDDECNELTLDELEDIRIAGKHLWNAYKRLRDIDVHGDCRKNK